jgi:hypothetical protein
VRPRTLSFFALALLIGVVIAVPQALAAPSEAKLEVNENCVEANWPCWATPGSGQPAAKVTIVSGGSVVYADSKTAVNLAWSGTAPTCEPSVPVAPTAPKTGWEGKCTFATPGTYKFESATLWPEYTKYEVVVEGSTSAPPPGTTGEGGSKGGTPGSGTPSPTQAGESPTGPPLSGAPTIAPTIHPSQRGTTVKGSLQIAEAGAGDRLEVDLLATPASPGKAGHATQVVGRFVSASVSAGQQSFSVKLNATARKALKRHHRLALKVKITLTPAHGEAISITRSVTVHA